MTEFKTSTAFSDNKQERILAVGDIITLGNRKERWVVSHARNILGKNMYTVLPIDDLKERFSMTLRELLCGETLADTSKVKVDVEEKFVFLEVDYDLYIPRLMSKTRMPNTVNEVCGFLHRGQFVRMKKDGVKYVVLEARAEYSTFDGNPIMLDCYLVPEDIALARPVERDDAERVQFRLGEQAPFELLGVCYVVDFEGMFARFEDRNAYLIP